MKTTISIISVFPQLHHSFIQTSLIQRAVEKGLLSFHFYQLSDFVPVMQRIDVPTVGPGPGMVLKPEVVSDAIERAQAEHGNGTIICFSPQGTPLTQTVLKQVYSKFSGIDKESPLNEVQVRARHLILVCARYEGIDARVEAEYADYVISIGDYVLMGGDLPAQVFLEGFLRLVPDVVGRAESVVQDSFYSYLLDYPVYAKPNEWRGKVIPEVLQSGNHEKISQWRRREALRSTLHRRFDWLRRHNIPAEQRAEVLAAIPPHAVVLMHDQIVVGKKQQEEGTTSVTSIDLHDIARSAATYGIAPYYIVTPLEDQKKLVERFLSFWHSYDGEEYNKNRFDALKRVVLCSSLEDVCVDMKRRFGKEPLLIATTARQTTFADKTINYTQQGDVWKKESPVLIVLGTGQGLAQSVLDRCSYILTPVEGCTTYNHLSVRSAAAVIFDRWLGLQVTTESE